MLQKNTQITLQIENLGADAEGVGRADGLAVFVQGALPGETVRVRVIKTAQRYAVGKLEEICAPSQDRVQPPCPVYARCGGCAAQHMRYEATLCFKRQQAIDCLTRIGHIDAPVVHPVWGMETPWQYRNKGSFPVGGTTEEPQIGFYAPRSHTIIDAPQGCLLQRPQSDALVQACREWMTRYQIAPYAESTHTGLIRHIVTRVSQDGRAMVALVIHADALPHAQELIAMLRAALSSFSGLVISCNRQRTNVIFGDACKLLWGSDTLEETLCGLRFSVSARAFFQVNPVQTERLYAAVLAYAALTPTDVAVDAYCGAGTITLLLARQCRQAIGVEIVPEAVENARENARSNGVENVAFHAGEAEKWLPQMLEAGMHPDVVVVDPPRKGCEETVLLAVAKAQPRRVVYVSCNPATLARDAQVLEAQGYPLREVQPVDMFCWSAGVECVALFERGRNG